MTTAGRSQGSQWHLLRVAHRHAVARPAGALWSLHDRVQSLQSLGQSGHLASDIRGAGGEIAAIAATDRLFDHPRPPARRRRKKGGPDNAIGRSRGGLSTKINAVVDQAGHASADRAVAGSVVRQDRRANLDRRARPGSRPHRRSRYDARAIVDLSKAAAAGPYPDLPRPFRVRSFGPSRNDGKSSTALPARASPAGRVVRRYRPRPLRTPCRPRGSRAPPARPAAPRDLSRSRRSPRD